jgi:hypothetical protein
MNPKFEVIVGNIGTVYSGNNFMVASCKFDAYVKQSKQEFGRACGESVTMLHNNKIRREYSGTIDNR